MSSANTGQPPAESVRVNIFGQTYSLRSTQGGERVRLVAEQVDVRMREIAAQLAVHDAAKVAVLAALNLADELHLVREHYEREIESLLTSGPEPAEETPTPAGLTSEPGGAAGEANGDAPIAAAEARTTGGATTGEAGGDARDSLTTAEAGESRGAETRGASGAAGRDEDARRSWFDDIFDSEFSSGGQGRLSSQVSSRLQRLRQTTREGTISDGEAGED